MSPVLIVSITSISGLLLGIMLFVGSRRRRMRRDQRAYDQAVQQGLHQPPSLHPVIDPDICIGSLACLSVCPEGDILGIIDGKAALINGANCIGHGACARECPVEAIKLVFGTSERGIDLPEVDAVFESSRAGIHVVGELGGMGLIKNALVQGLQTAEYLARAVRPSNTKGALDVLIVGAGPAGIASALGCRQAGLSFSIIDQGTLGGSVAHYPRQKVVMVDTVKLPFYGEFGKQSIAKEDLLQTFEKILGAAKIKVQEETKVERINGNDGDFIVQTNRGMIRARKVILAIGRRGTPRPLDVEGENLEKVTYRLIDPQQYRGNRVMVVGAGDAAMESALMLAEQSGTKVTLVVRQEAITRGRPANRERLEQFIAARKIQVIFNAQVGAIHPKKVILRVLDKSQEIANDYVIINVGGVLPLDFLKECGVEVRRFFGEELGASKAAGKGARIIDDENDEEKRRRRFARQLGAIGALIILVLTVVGWRYYSLSPALRVRSPLHSFFRPGGLWGHGVGIVATLFMLTNFSYAVRKRWSWLKSNSSIRQWLTFHMFVGFMSPLVIAYHAAFQSKNLFATGTYVALLIVVVTGVIGKYIYGLVPASGGKTLEYSELLGRVEQANALVRPLFNKPVGAKLKTFLEWATAPSERGSSALVVLTTLPSQWLRLYWGLGRLRVSMGRGDDYRTLSAQLKRLLRLKNQIRVYNSIKYLLASWRVLHVILAVALVGLITIHIYISIYYGYRWIFGKTVG